MIASVGLRTLIENKVNMASNRNLLIVSVIFSFGVGGIVFKFGQDFAFAGIASAAIVGIVLNLVLPLDKEPSEATGGKGAERPKRGK
jgi:uracil permease